MDKQVYVPPRLIFVTGVPGSGKSSFCKGRYQNDQKISNGLLDLVSAVYIDKDVLTSGLFPDDERGEIYEHIRPKIYGLMDGLAYSNLKVKNSVIIDAPFSKDTKYSLSVANPKWHEKYSKISQEYGAVLKVIRCVAPEEEIFKRLKDRGYKRDLSKLQNWNSSLKEEPINLEIPDNHLIIDNSLDPTKNLETVINFLGSN